MLSLNIITSGKFLMNKKKQVHSLLSRKLKINIPHAVLTLIIMTSLNKTTCCYKFLTKKKQLTQ